MLEKVFGLFGIGKTITPEKALDLIIASERKTTGWVRTVDTEGRFLGFRFYCPGKFIKSTRPPFLGERDGAGNVQTAEVPITQRAGCAYVSSEILPVQTLADIHCRCAQCGTESVLLTWMRENKVSQFENIPTEQRVPSRPQKQMAEVGWDSTGDFVYEQADPAGNF